MLATGIELFEQDCDALKSIASQYVNSEEELAALFQRFHYVLLDINFSRYTDLGRLRVSAPNIIRRLFHLRMQLRDRISEWHHAGYLSVQNEKSLRDIFRLSRYIVDMVGELHIGNARLDGDDGRYRAFYGPETNTLFHPSFEERGSVPTFQSGDVLLVRGKLHNSAAIARIGDVDSQFSHTSIIYVDKAGKQWVVESVIEQGATITPLEQALDHGLSRAVLFRHRDSGLAHRAADFIYNHVLQSLNGRKPKIFYDFTMHPEGYDRLFCSKLIRQAFDAASQGYITLPTFMTNLTMSNRDFLNRIGVSVTQTFAPGDLELEPNFHLIAEWRDYRDTSDLRLQDLVMDKFFEWMESHNFKFRETFTIKLIGVLGKLSSYISRPARHLIDGILPVVPKNMSRRTIATVAMLHSTAEEVFQELRDAELRHIKEIGHPMHPGVVLNYIERIRQREEDIIGYLEKHAQ